MLTRYRKTAFGSTWRLGFVIMMSFTAAMIGPVTAGAQDQITIIGEFQGCGFGQGIMGCSIKTLFGQTYYFDDAGSPAELFDRIDIDFWKGKMIQIKGRRDGEIIILSDIGLLSPQPSSEP